MVETVNLVAGGSLNRELDIGAISSSAATISNVTVEKSETADWQLPLRFDGGGIVILYRTGSYIIRGGSSFESLSETKSMFFSFLDAIGLEVEDVSCHIQNIVFIDEFGFSVDLSELLVLLGFENTEYEPEQFPAIIYRPPEFEVVILIFSNGKMVVTGITDEDVAEESVLSVKELVESSELGATES